MVLSAPSTAQHGQAGLYPPIRAWSRGMALGRRDATGAAHGALHGLMQLQAWEKPPPLWFGCRGGAAAQLPGSTAGSPPLPRPGAWLRRVHVFPCLSRRRLRERSDCSEDPRPWGAARWGCHCLCQAQSRAPGQPRGIPRGGGGGDGHPEHPRGVQHRSQPPGWGYGAADDGAAVRDQPLHPSTLCPERGSCV